MHKLEFRRQVLHLMYGFALIFLHRYGLINQTILLVAILAGSAMSLMIKKKKLSPIARLLSIFERDHHMEAFPGRGILFFTIGAYLTFLLFEVNVAYAAIAILSTGDALSNVIGRQYGRTKTRLNPDKFIEGNLVGILAAIPMAYLFFPHFYAVFAASTVGMFLEIPHIKIFGFEIDDNLIIPIGSAFTLTLFL